MTVILLGLSWRMAALVLAAWLVLGLVVGLTLGRFLRDTDRAARQLHQEERRRSGGALDELSRRRRRRPQR